MSIEDSLDIKPPDNARVIRNLIEGAQFLHSHILWFYHLNALDLVDPVSALDADVKEAARLAVAAGTEPGDLVTAKKRLETLVKGGRLSIFTNGYPKHPAYKLPPELNLIAVTHYLQALEMQAESNSMVAVMGGKFPHFMTAPPGGVLFVPTPEKLGDFWGRLQRVKRFIDNVMIPDLLAIAPFYLELAKVGKGHSNFLAWGVFESPDFKPENRVFPRGAIFSADLSKVEKARPEDVVEFVDHSWYTVNSGRKNPAEGKTEIKFTRYDTKDKYSWIKAPRFKGKPMEVGPLARMLIAYVAGRKRVRKLIDDTLAALGQAGKLEILLSVLGRTAARALEAKLIADEMVEWFKELTGNLKKGQVKVFTSYEVPGKAKGVGLWEAPRGALAHWNRIENKRIAHYQVVTPSAWNFSPRDADDVRGPVEEALIGTPVINPKQPLEVLRTVHSFDP